VTDVLEEEDEEKVGLWPSSTAELRGGGEEEESEAVTSVMIEEGGPARMCTISIPLGCVHS
jgi:hypothetical protein